MPRTKATAPYWCTPGGGSRESQREVRRQSPRLQKQQIDDAANPSRPKSFINPQIASPFFRPDKGLPREIRDVIFELVLTSYEDTTKPRNMDTIKATSPHDVRYYKHRPGHFYPNRTDTALLRTCRLVYSETRLIPVAVNTHNLRYNHIRVCSYPVSTIARKYFNRMTSEQLAAVQHLHIFAERSRLSAADHGQYISYSAFAELGYLREKRNDNPERKESSWGLGGPYPQTLTITIRHMDWVYPRGTHEMHLESMLQNEHWENVFGGLKTLKMELEKWEAEKASLEPIVQRLQDFVFDIGNGEVLVAEEDARESTWTGPLYYRDGDLKWKDVNFSVFTITWRVQSGKRKGCWSATNG